MITKPIVFILGAGASCPYGFPTGAELKNEIIKSLDIENNSKVVLELKKLLVKESLIKRFKERLEKSRFYSVDAFLEKHTDFTEIGKMCIAMNLIKYEDEKNLDKPPSQNQNWYQYLYNKMKTSKDNLAKNSISIITFNYDRSFEHYFFEAMKNDYILSDVECAQVIDNFNIIHMYGQLGKLPLQGGKWRPYNAEYSWRDLYDIIDQINIISDNDKLTPDIKRAQDCIKRGSIIYFLGFGFNDTNVSRLGDGLFSTHAKPMGTAYKMPEGDIAEIESRYRGRNKGIELINADVLSFLSSNHVRFS